MKYLAMFACVNSGDAGATLCGANDAKHRTQGVRCSLLLLILL